MTRPVKIEVDVHLDAQEVQRLRVQQQTIVNSIIQARVGQQFSSPTNFIGYLVSEEGKERSKQVTTEVSTALQRLELNNMCKLSLTISASQPPIAAGDVYSQLFVSQLDQGLPPSRTVFSYFPADRAMPVGETAIQFGAADASLQLESHNSQPQLKYQRLKNTIFNTLVATPAGASDLRSDLDPIFGRLLRDLHFASAGISPIGTVSILVEDANGKRFQVDCLSSGEKGLLLTFLTISRTLEEGGVVLIDEPEQHLNPAVCKDIVPFIVEHYSKRRNLQFILCSHSPEILAGAFSSPDCGLWRIDFSIRMHKTAVARPGCRGRSSEAPRQFAGREFDI